MMNTYMHLSLVKIQPYFSYKSKSLQLKNSILSLVVFLFTVLHMQMTENNFVLGSFLVYHTVPLKYQKMLRGRFFCSMQH